MTKPGHVRSEREKEYARAYMLKYEQCHREEKKERNRQYRAGHLEEERQRSHQYYLDHKEEALVKAKEYRESHKEELKASAWARRLLRVYGLTIEDWESLMNDQGGVCAICGEEMENRLLCVDHDHDTGEVRGLLCVNCNAALGGFKDSPELLEKAAAYLRRYSVEE